MIDQWLKYLPVLNRPIHRSSFIVHRSSFNMKPRLLIAVLVLILLLLWFLAGRLPPILAVDHMWPILLVGGGGFSLWVYFGCPAQPTGRLLAGLLALGLGCYFFLFTLEIRLPVLGRFQWRRLGEFWPGFIIVVGLAFVGQYILGGFKARDALAAGLLILALGGVAFAFSLGFLSAVLGRQLLNLWPLALIGLGLGILLRFRRRLC
jgi:hypothetical protein